MGPKVPYYRIFGLEPQQTIVIFQISTFELVWLQNFEETEMSKFWTKNALFSHFWAGIWKQYCHIWNQHPRICLIAKYREIMKMPKFGTKSALFGYFWARILKNYCHIWNQHPQICLFAKFHKKNKKCLNLEPKMSDLCTFRQESESNIVIFEISTLKFV